MFRTNWKKWAFTAIVSAALLPAATFAKSHHASTIDKQPATAKTSTTEAKHGKKKLAHRSAPAKKLVHKTTPSKKLVAKTHATKKLTSKKVSPHKLTSKKVAPTKLTSKTSHRTTKLSTHKKILLNAKGKTVKA